MLSWLHAEQCSPARVARLCAAVMVRGAGPLGPLEIVFLYTATMVDEHTNHHEENLREIGNQASETTTVVVDGPPGSLRTEIIRCGNNLWIKL